MKIIKTVFCMLLIFVLAFSFVGCSFGGIMKSITSGAVDVDKDGNVKIKGEDGEVDIGTAKWDKSKMHGLEEPKAKLESCISTDGTTIYSFSEMKEKDAEAYISLIKDAGFTFDTLTMDDYSFTGTNKDGLIISFLFDKESGSGTITSSKGDPPSGDSDGEGAVIGGKDNKWDSEKVGGLPDPGVNIISYWSVDGDTSYSFEKIDNHLEYVEEIKACGFTVDESVVEIDDTYMYTAANSNGDQITFSLSVDVSSVTFTKND